MIAAVVLGTRPEIIKLCPLLGVLGKKNSRIIFTGQHYDYVMGLRFVDQLGMSTPDYSFVTKGTKPAAQMGSMMEKLSEILERTCPDTVIVQGDTNTVLAASLSSLKSGIPVSHVESGLRSFDWRMPEEHNRIATDHISEILFAPTKTSKENLLNESVHGRIFVTGNTVIDAVNAFIDSAEKKSSLEIDLDSYVLMTLHRAENVDDKKTLSSVINGALNSKANFVFPIHPRTLKRLKQFGLYRRVKDSVNILPLDSVGYFDMLKLMKKSAFILTDSGGLQEEATSPKLRKKVLVARKTTDRPESVAAGLSEIVGIGQKGITAAINRTLDDPKPRSRKTPYGRGDASIRIARILEKHF